MHVDSMEGELGAFNEILKRKDSAIQAQVYQQAGGWAYTNHIPTHNYLKPNHNHLHVHDACGAGVHVHGICSFVVAVL